MRQLLSEETRISMVVFHQPVIPGAMQANLALDRGKLHVLTDQYFREVIEMNMAVYLPLAIPGANRPKSAFALGKPFAIELYDFR